MQKAELKSLHTSMYSTVYNTLYSTVYSTIYIVVSNILEVCGVFRHSLGCNLKISEDQTGIVTLTVNKTVSHFFLSKLEIFQNMA